MPATYACDGCGKDLGETRPSIGHIPTTKGPPFYLSIARFGLPSYPLGPIVDALAFCSVGCAVEYVRRKLERQPG